MSYLVYVTIWVLASVAVGLCVGFYLGRNTHVSREREVSRKERALMLKTLVNLLQSTEQLKDDVVVHNTEIAQVGRHVGDLKVTGEMEDVQRELLDQISNVLHSNQKLEEDLQYTRYRMEEQAQEIDRTRLEARTDVLSGVANRKAFNEKLQYLLTRWKREGDPFALIMCDVDHFKWINDTHGHPAGDRVVGHVGTFLHSYVREGDFVSRYGGDEFAVLLPNSDLETGHKIAERLRVAIARSNFEVGVKGERAALTFSVGVTAVRRGEIAEKVIERVDQALYRAKQGGRNQVQMAVDDRLAVPVEDAAQTLDEEQDAADALSATSGLTATNGATLISTAANLPLCPSPDRMEV